MTTHKKQPYRIYLSSNCIVNKRKKIHQERNVNVNGKGKLILARRIISKKDCTNNCKFKCGLKTDKALQETIFVDFHKLDTNGKHSLTSQKIVLSFNLAGNNITSAFIPILKKVVTDHSNVSELVCWSGSHVPQNRKLKKL